MKKRLILFVVALMAVTLSGTMIGCRREPVREGWKDGIYFAVQEDFSTFSGWKYTVTIEVSEGKITAVNWDAAHINAGKSKKQTSIDGEYRMVERGGASSEWHEQAALVENFLIEKQDVGAIPLQNGSTDAITGVTIQVSDFVALAAQALAGEPVGRGPFSDGAKYAEMADFHPQTGWKPTLSLTVINGYVVSANWSAIRAEGGKDKKQASIDGEYRMKERGGASSEWHEQAWLMERHLIETQDVNAIPVRDGYTDAVTGVTIQVSDFILLAREALK